MKFVIITATLVIYFVCSGANASVCYCTCTSDPAGLGGNVRFKYPIRLYIALLTKFRYVMYNKNI